MNIYNSILAINDKLTSKKNTNALFFLLLTIYTIYMLFLCQKLSIWQDEAYSLSTTANSFSKVIYLSYHFEGQPPMYFIILTMWRKINDGIFFARLLSLIFTFISAFVLNRIGKLIFKEIWSKWLIAIFLLNPFTIWSSLEIRLYSFLIMLAFIAIYIFYQIYFYNRKKNKVIFIIISLLGIYTQYYFVFLIISLSILLLFSKGKTLFFDFCIWFIPVVLLFLPNLLFIGDQYEMHNNTQVDYTILNRVRYIFATPLGFFSGFANDVTYGRLLGWFFRLFFVPFFFVSLYKLYLEHKKQEFEDSLSIFQIFIPIIIILAIFLIIFASSNLIYDSRYMSISYPFHCLLFATFGIFNKDIQKIVYTAIITYFVFLLIIIYRPPYLKTDDNKSLSTFVQNIENPNEPILFRDKSIVLSFNQYYLGRNSLNTIPQLKFDYNFFNDDLKDTIEFKNEFAKISGKSKSILFITGNDLGFTTKKTLTNTLIDRFLRFNYQISLDTVFKGKKEVNNLRIRRLWKNPK